MSSSWFDCCQKRVSRVAGFTANTDERRRVGRYVMWCHALALDSDERNSDRVEEFLRDARQIRNGLHFDRRQKKQYRDAIEGWHDWRDTHPFDI